MIRVGSGVDALIASIPELKSYEVKINNNTIDIGVILVKKELRERDRFQVQDEVVKKLSYLQSQ